MAKFPKDLYAGAIKMVGSPIYAKPLEQAFKKTRDKMFPQNREKIITKPDPLTEANLNKAYMNAATQLATQLDKKACKNLTPFCVKAKKSPPSKKGKPFKTLKAKLYNSFSVKVNNLEQPENEFEDDFTAMKTEYVKSVKKTKKLSDSIKILYNAAFIKK